jgi:hypothetical protein
MIDKVCNCKPKNMNMMFFADEKKVINASYCTKCGKGKTIITTNDLVNSQKPDKTKWIAIK